MFGGNWHLDSSIWVFDARFSNSSSGMQYRLRARCWEGQFNINLTLVNCSLFLFVTKICTLCFLVYYWVITVTSYFDFINFCLIIIRIYNYARLHWIATCSWSPCAPQWSPEFFGPQFLSHVTLGPKEDALKASAFKHQQLRVWSETKKNHILSADLDV